MQKQAPVAACGSCPVFGIDPRLEAVFSHRDDRLQLFATQGNRTELLQQADHRSHGALGLMDGLEEVGCPGPTSGGEDPCEGGEHALQQLWMRCRASGDAQLLPDGCKPALQRRCAPRFELLALYKAAQMLDNIGGGIEAWSETVDSTVPRY